MTPFPRAGIKTWLAAMTNLPVGNIVWEDEPEPIVGPDNTGKVTGILHVNMTSSTPVFWETRRSDAPGTTGATTPVGTPNAQFDTIEQAYVNLSLVYECYAPATTTLAYDTLTKVRVRAWQWPNLQLLLSAAKCFFIDTGNVNRVPNVSRDTRAISVATLDVKISHGQVDTYFDDFIETVSATGTVDIVPVTLAVDATKPPPGS